MRDARGLDLTADDPAAVAAADDFAARLLRLDRGVIQLYAAAFWLTARPTAPARLPAPTCVHAKR